MRETDLRLGLAPGYKGLNYHDDLVHDPLVAVAVGEADPEGHVRRLFIGFAGARPY